MLGTVSHTSPHTHFSYIVRIGATMSREAMRIPSSAIRAVSSKAQVGSPLAFPWPNTWHTCAEHHSQAQEVIVVCCFTNATCFTLTLKKGMTLSLAMACSRRGAPVKDWRPAPHVEKKEPMTMTQGEGQARVPTTRFPLTESPNLQEAKIKAITTVVKQRQSLITQHI